MRRDASDVCFDTFRDNMQFSLQMEITPMNRNQTENEKNIKYLPTCNRQQASPMELNEKQIGEKKKKEELIKSKTHIESS